MKKKVLCTVMILVLLLAAAVSAYAETGIQPRDTDSVTFVTNRTGRTTADVAVSVSFTEVVDRYSIIIYLQKKENGEWVNDWQNEEYVFFNNGSKKETFLFGNTYTHLSEGVIYRIKCVSKDYIGDSTFIFTTYSNQF
ncbi:MAG: hypothetical protein PUE84_10620 [Firmicutes bacterium]|nr:hypothetical protein [Bacillota bacterium]